ncbi:hypothetical protein nbrc107696_43770 [Gordonia spumicola]|uniref:Uncharacterized protein n=1 Tax=Gordonia spumicola TaxID=589161 RepID=A0A7I9VFR0_9ACTN|nr:hypothetical protein [Gordonia spumicola]GEE03931.1 hypothetical protein nbrc107696_43770 [Gordonia spumicola]
MSFTCEPAAREVADHLGFVCDDANPIVTFRNPFGLDNWTLPVLELLIVAGAVFALIHAWRRWRRDGDAVNLTLWFGSLVYLAIIEPPLYFPSWFGLDEYVGFIFSHNVFTVQFMFDRLPLYIVAFYPVISAVTYEVVRALGVFERRGPLAGAVAVAFASQVFYETFDQLGPQLKWWAWNPENMINQPMFTSVPMNSMWVFASVSFGVLAWLAAKFSGTKNLSGGQVTLRTIAAGVLTPILMVVLAAPTRVGVDTGGEATLQRTLVIILLAVLWLAGLWLLVEGTRATWNRPTGLESPQFVRVYPALYLGVLTVLWIASVPEFLGAVDGVTDRGTPIGSAWYSVLCIAGSAWFVIAAIRAARPAPAVADVGDRGAVAV